MSKKDITEKGHYLDVRDGVEMKEVNLVVVLIMSIYVTVPIQGILLGIGIYRGLILEDGSFMVIALSAAIALMAIRSLFYNKSSNLYDRVVGSANIKMWSNINENIKKKYGQGSVVPFVTEIEKVTPPYKQPRKNKSPKEKVKVMLNSLDGHEQKILQTGKGFEPILTDLPK